jgi:prepilin-type N-terminal cleavage/methylation domain-containing protein
MKRGFTLVELLVVISIIVLLAVLAVPSYRIVQVSAWKSGCLSNLHQISVAALLFAGENDQQLPGRSRGATSQRWPQVLSAYASSPRIFVDPREAQKKGYDPAQIWSNVSNHGSFFMNGMNDLGAYTDPTVTINLTRLEHRVDVILFAQKKAEAGDFYMDFVEKNQNGALDKTAYTTGSNYAFADGGARFVKATDYQDSWWLTNPDYKIP